MIRQHSVQPDHHRAQHAHQKMLHLREKMKAQHQQVHLARVHLVIQISSSKSSGQTTRISDVHVRKPHQNALPMEFPWIERTSEGYKCKTCSVAFKKGPWVTELTSLASSKKLGDKASKHAKCIQHKTALEASQCLSTLCNQC